MDWLRAFPYKWQTLEMSLGFIAIVSGGIFLMISLGSKSPLWIILGASFGCFGVICTTIGAIWCVWSVRIARGIDEHALYGPRRDYEVETLTSDRTEMIY